MGQAWNTQVTGMLCAEGSRRKALFLELGSYVVEMCITGVCVGSGGRVLPPLKNIYSGV